MTRPTENPMRFPASDYVRPALTLTRQAAISPDLEVIARCDEAEQLIDHLGRGELDADGTLRLLASAAWIERADADMCRRFERWGDLEPRLHRVVETMDRDAVHAAIGRFSVDAWLERLRALHMAVGGMPGELDEEAEAEELIDALDDGQLAFIVAARRGVYNRDVENDLARCTDVLGDHAELFVSASGYIQAVAATFVRDVDERPDLFVTAAKFALLLDELEEFERMLSGEEQPAAAAPGLGAALPLAARSTRAAADATLSTPVAMAALVEDGRPRTMRFTSPDGRFSAAAVFPAQPQPRSRVWFEFADARGRPAPAMLGRIAGFAGQRCRIGLDAYSQVVAVFRVADVLHVPEVQHAFRVDDTAWRLAGSSEES